MTIAGMVLLSAALHPFWNALIKKAISPEGAFLGMMVVLVPIALVHGLATGADFWAIFAVWPVLLLSVAGQILYGLALVAVLKRGQLSAYYPIIRSSPLFVVAAGFLFLGERYPASLLFGIGLVLIGAFALQYRRGSRILEDPVTLGLAFLAMAGTGIYSLADSAAMRTVTPPVMLFWVQLICSPILMLLLPGVVGPGAWARLGRWLKAPWRLIGVGCICYASYALILAAYGMGGNVAAVTSVRQASIPLSVLIGGLYFREGSVLRRLMASAVLVLGILIILKVR